MNEKQARTLIVDAAKSYLGFSEASGKHRRIIDIYNEQGKQPPPRGYRVTYSDAWCATFISAIAIQCGMSDIIPQECSCYYQVVAFAQLGEWCENDAYKPTTGDIIYYDWQDSGAGDNTGAPDHVGIVEKCEGGTITVIEGNKNDSVERRTLKVDGKYIRGYGLPDYAKWAAKHSEDNRPWFEKDGTWKRAQELGLMDGTRPYDTMKRCELAAVAVRLYDKLKEDKA